MRREASVKCPRTDFLHSINRATGIFFQDTKTPLCCAVMLLMKRAAGALAACFTEQLGCAGTKSAKDYGNRV